MLRLDAGDDPIHALEELARRQGISAGVVVSGIGLFSRATLGYWNGSTYAPLEVTVPHEVVSLQGSIAEADGRPSVHLHAALAGPDHRVVGGHLLKATVGLLLELLVDSFAGHAFGRPLVEELGVRRIDLGADPARRAAPGPAAP